MARRGGAGAQIFLPVAVVIAVLMFLGVVMLMVRSGRNPSGPGSSISPSTSSSTPSGSPSPSATAAATPSVAASVAPSSGAVAPSAGATARPGGAPPQAAGPNNMPNTGPPFPWWMGLLPVSLGIGLAWALRPKREPMVGASVDGGTVAFSRERREVSRPRGRPASALGKKRP